MKPLYLYVPGLVPVHWGFPQWMKGLHTGHLWIHKQNHSLLFPAFLESLMTSLNVLLLWSSLFSAGQSRLHVAVSVKDFNGTPPR